MLMKESEQRMVKSFIHAADQSIQVSRTSGVERNLHEAYNARER